MGVFPCHMLFKLVSKAILEQFSLYRVIFYSIFATELRLVNDVGIGGDVGGRVERFSIVHTYLFFYFQLRLSLLFCYLLGRFSI